MRFTALVSFIVLLNSAVALPSNVFRMTPEILTDINSYGNATSNSEYQFQVYDDAFLDILGDAPTLSLILNSANTSFPQFHEAAILASSDPPVLFVTSNQYNYSGIDSPTTSQKVTVISRITQDPSTQEWSAEIISPTGTGVHFANGGTLGADGSLIFCHQGDLVNPGGLLKIEATAPYTTTNVINSYMGIPFNSLNDVTRTSDGALWFTDPHIGYNLGLRPPPKLPPQVYRYTPGTSDLRVVVGDLTGPNGITFSPDESIAYITDTSVSDKLPTNAKTIYAYDVVPDGPGPLLVNKRTFGFPSVFIPDGIKTDEEGNVYVGCGDGVNVWDPQGKLLGKILVKGGVSNFALGQNGTLILLNEDKVFLATLGGLAESSGYKSGSMGIARNFRA